MKPIYYHPSVPNEVREIFTYYESITQELSDQFWIELSDAINKNSEFPERHHFDKSGRRRCNLKRFPYHILFRVFDTYIRVTVIRHNKKSEDFGVRRK